MKKFYQLYVGDMIYICRDNGNWFSEELGYNITKFPKIEQVVVSSITKTENDTHTYEIQSGIQHIRFIIDDDMNISVKYDNGIIFASNIKDLIIEIIKKIQLAQSRCNNFISVLDQCKQKYEALFVKP